MASAAHDALLPKLVLVTPSDSTVKCGPALLALRRYPNLSDQSRPYPSCYSFPLDKMKVVPYIVPRDNQTFENQILSGIYKSDAACGIARLRGRRSHTPGGCAEAAVFRHLVLRSLRFFRVFSRPAPVKYFGLLVRFP